MLSQVIKRCNFRKELSDVASCDHIDLAACWSCGTISSANLETINSNVTGLMDVRVRRLLLAAVESDATVESGHIFPLLWQRPTPLSLVRKTSWSPTLPCCRWPPLRPSFCTTAQIREFLRAHPTTSSPSPNVYTCQKRVSRMLHVAQFRLLGLGTAPQQRRAPHIEERKRESS